nr:fibronectin type III domain-containing protein [Paenibacillus tyrfis]
MMLVLLLQVLPVSSAQAATSKYTGGLLDGVTLNVGPSFNKPTSTVMQFTDNNGSTGNNIGSNIAWYTFSAPKDINAVIAKWHGLNPIKMEFYDANNTLISSYTSTTNDGVESLPSTLQNVSHVVLKPVTAGDTLFVYEWNVFTTPSFPPVTPTINWFRGGDRVVDLYWTTTGAKSYTVKRSTSAGGPYAVLASNIKEISFTDTSVVNGTTYYYVVTAVNEAGESAVSNEINIKPSATKYTGGLLDGVALNVGPSFNKPMSTVMQFTDNNGNTGNNIGSNIAWYTFSAPKDINAVIAKWHGLYPIKMEFYDANNTLISTYTPTTNDGVESLPSTLQNVSRVVLKPVTAGETIFAYEWNVFTTPSFPPVTPTINWFRGGDRVVDLYWTTTGAKSYTVKRSTSAGGPYAVLASNIKEISFTDTSVVNGTTYYYVVTAVNEAGESAVSNEINIKPSATKYTGGLLDGVALNVGPSFNKPMSTVMQFTDNNGNTGTNIGSNIAWYTFSTPKDINAVIAKWHGLYPIKMEFYDANNTLISTYTPTTNDGVESLPNTLQNVSRVVLKPVTAGETIFAYEWNVFGKNHDVPPAAPLNLTAVGGDKTVSLTWNSMNTATSYKVKRSTTAGGPYTEISTVNSATYASYLDTNVVNGTTYYYVVTAVNAAGESPNSNEASATPNGSIVTPPTQDTDRALLRIMLNNGEEKEYDLSMKEVNAFLAWYEGRASGTGAVMFAIDKHNNNKGPFKNRKDYIIYDKIITFEVNAYTADSGNSNTDSKS